ELLDSRGARFLAAGSPHRAVPRRRDQLAVVVDDDRPTGVADRQRGEEARQLVEGDVDAVDVLAAIGLLVGESDRDAGLPAGEEDVGRRPEQAGRRDRADVPGPFPRIEIVAWVAPAPELLALRIAQDPGHLAAAGAIDDFLELGPAGAAAPDQQV